MDQLKQMLPFILPLVLLHYTLAVIAVVDLVKRKKVRFLNKYVWGAIVILVEVFGPVAYFLLRGNEE